MGLNTEEIVANILMMMFTILMYYCLAIVLTGDKNFAIIAGLMGIMSAKSDINETKLENKIFDLEQKLNNKK